jgi:hypothetical protein
MHRATLAVVLALASAPVLATAAQAPEPDTIGLLAAGAVAGLVAWIRKRRR